jgi:hypothetical protein
LHPGQPHRALQRQFANARGDGGIVERDAPRVEGLHLVAGIVNPFAEAAQRKGFQVHSLQLKLFGLQCAGGAVIGGGPVQAKADGESDDGNQ